ncbi:hypothetical protein ACFL3V_04530 [Nanoarchaeota archaeon]
MRLRRSRLSRMGKIRMPGMAKTQKEKLKRKIRQHIPVDGEDFGRRIEERISSSQKIWRNVSVAFFAKKSLENLSYNSSYLLGFLMVVIVGIIRIFPTDMDSFYFGAVVNNLLVVIAGLLIANIITYVAIRAMGADTKFRVFFSTVNTAVFMSIIIVAIPAVLVLVALFSTMLTGEAAIKMFFSIVPFYNYLVFGWAAESLARLKRTKSVIVGLISLLVILLTNIIVGELMV